MLPKQMQNHRDPQPFVLAADAQGDVTVVKAVIALRSAVGLPPVDPPPMVDVPESMPADVVVPAVDLRSWIAWSTGCLPLFAHGRLPTVKAATVHVRSLLTVLAARDAGGVLTFAAARIGTHVAGVSSILRRLGIYPWPRERARGNGSLGSRVVAVARIDPAANYLYGRGVYEADERPPVGVVTYRLNVVMPGWPPSQPTPRFRLDDGGTIWGVQCRTWMLEDEYAQLYPDKPERIVPLPKRARVPGP